MVMMMMMMTTTTIMIIIIIIVISETILYVDCSMFYILAVDPDMGHRTAKTGGGGSRRSTGLILGKIWNGWKKWSRWREKAENYRS